MKPRLRPLKKGGLGADEWCGQMTDPSEGIVEQYAEHLQRKASSSVLTLSVCGVIGGAALGAIPGLLGNSVISPGANYFAILLGAIAGGFLGRMIGDRRAVGLRLQAQMALHQLQFESRAVQAQAAPVARAAAPAPAPAPVAAPVAPPPVAPPVAPPPVAAPAPPIAAPPVAPPEVAPAPVAPAPAVAAPVAAPVPAVAAPVAAPAPFPVAPAPAPLLPAAPAQPPAPPVVPVIRTDAAAGLSQPVPRLLESATPGLPPLSVPPLSG